MIIVIKVDIWMFLEWKNSGKFQNNAFNDVKQISLSHVTMNYNLLPKLLASKKQWVT